MTALQWHLLRQASAAARRPIACIACHRPYVRPPPLGRCVCGGYIFEVEAAGAAQPTLPLELAHG